MKRLLRSLLLAAILSALLCVGALAAESEPVKGGIYNISVDTNVTLKPNTEATTDTVDGTEYTDYYANAVKFDVKAENLTENQQYLLMVLKGGADGSAPGVPTAENIAYIDQAAAQNGSVSFAAYPKELTKGKYYVYLVGGGTAFAQSQVASFEYDKKYTLGDVNGDGNVDSADALLIRRCSVGLTPYSNIKNNFAGFVTGLISDSKMAPDSGDALAIRRYAVGLINRYKIEDIAVGYEFDVENNTYIPKA